MNLRPANIAVHAALDARLPANVAVGFGEPPEDTTLPYVIFYPAQSTRATARGMSGGSGVLIPTVQISTVGQTHRSVDVVADLVRDALWSSAIEDSDVIVADIELVSESENRDGGAGAPRAGELARRDLRVSFWPVNK